MNNLRVSTIVSLELPNTTPQKKKKEDWLLKIQETENFNEDLKHIKQLHSESKQKQNRQCLQIQV